MMTRISFSSRSFSCSNALISSCRSSSTANDQCLSSSINVSSVCEYTAYWYWDSRNCRIRSSLGWSPKEEEKEAVVITDDEMEESDDEDGDDKDGDDEADELVEIEAEDDGGGGGRGRG